ncbi:hypothetical protein SteCoe_21352 [Stentor coeruleus]|uniref:Uncharacterized protein n=1 Tax=Stentor coeruleus TaxID=5963 RepID=A0A1R2BPS6_9CILI|nr:hypothetical protein SteCoe_21352 [Stentor coeruleus]
MFGIKQCVKLYCNDSKTFLCFDSDNQKNCMGEFLTAMSRGISNGLYSRSAFFLEQLNKIEETQDFYLYFLMKEGLAITYAMAGLQKVAKVLYDQILSPPEIYCQNFGSITDDELTRVTEITMQEFRSNNKAMSHLYLRKYVFSCQKRLLEAVEDYIGIGHLSLNFVCTCLGLFKTIGEREEKYLGNIWVYNHSLELAKYLQDKSKDINDPEVRTVLHYSVGLMLSLVRSRLQILSKMKFNNHEILMDLEPVSDFSLDRSPVKIEGKALRPKGIDDERPLEILSKSDLSLEAVFETQYRLEEALLILTHSLYENFSQANYQKFAARYKVEQGILLTTGGMYEQANEVLSSIKDIEWDWLQVVVLLHRLQCLLNTGRLSEAVSIGLKICRFSETLKPNTIPRLWKCIEDISHISKTEKIYPEELFPAEIKLNNTRVLQGDIIEATCRFTNKLPCSIEFDKVTCQYFAHRGNNTVILECKNLTLAPGTSFFKISGVASAQGKLKNTNLYMKMNRLLFVIEVVLTTIVIDENTKCVSLINKVPSLLVYNEPQLLAIEVSTRQFPIENGIIDIRDSEDIVFNKSKAECISYTKEGKNNKILDIKDCEIKMPFLPSHSRLYIIVEIMKSRTFEETEKKGSTEMCSSVNFMKKYSQKNAGRHLIVNKLTNFTETVDFHVNLVYSSHEVQLKEHSTSSLDFILPLTITSKLIKHSNLLLLQIQVLNCSHLSIKTIHWELTNCKIIDDPNYKMILRTGQIQHLSFIIKGLVSPAKITLTYSSALKSHGKKMHIDSVIDKKMKEQHFIMDHYFLVDEVASYRISEPVVIGLECCVVVSLLNGKTAKVRVEKTNGWDIKSPGLQEFIDRVELNVVPCKAGNLKIPEIIVWVGEKIIRTEGPKKVFVSPILRR